MKERVRVMFVSQRNTLRSVLAQACLTHLAPDQFMASSCGRPGKTGRAFHPAAVGALGSAGMAVPSTQPQGWDALLRGGAAPAHFVITLDEEIAAIAPRWPGQPELATWPFPDLAANPEGEEMAVAVIRMLYSLRRRLELLVSLPLQGSDRSAIRSDVRDLAHWQ